MQLLNAFTLFYIYIQLKNISYGVLAKANTSNQTEHNKLVQQPAGNDVRLHCGIYGHHADFMNQSKVEWDFKKCDSINQHIICKGSDVELREWTPVKCDVLPCKATILTINNAQESASGLYRCSVQPYRPDNRTTLQIQMVKTYQLDIIDLTISAPVLLDNLPTNTTVPHGTQVVLQCRVRSKVLPTIKWFRKQDSSTEFNLDTANGTQMLNDRVVQYLENTYEHLDSDGEKGLTDDTYLSKLKFNDVTDRDAGFYICVGINYGGYALHEARLEVIHSVNKIDDDADVFGTKQLLLLFLFPIGLAMVPLSMWCCYILYKRRSVAKCEHVKRRKYRVRSDSIVFPNEVYV